MKQEFISSLEENLRYLGFGGDPRLYDELLQKMEEGNKEFQITTESRFDEWSTAQATLHFRRAENDAKYFFVRYDALLSYPDSSEYNRLQTFYITRGTGVSFKEAFNLLQGRAVHKQMMNMDEEKYYAWIQLDFIQRTPDNTNYKIRQFRGEYGYDIVNVLKGYPIKEMENEDLRMNLILSLKKGNLHPVTFVKERKQEKAYIAACPQFKTITICTEATRFYHVFPTIKKKNIHYE